MLRKGIDKVKGAKKHTFFGTHLSLISKDKVTHHRPSYH